MNKDMHENLGRDSALEPCAAAPEQLLHTCPCSHVVSFDVMSGKAADLALKAIADAQEHAGKIMM